MNLGISHLAFKENNTIFNLVNILKKNNISNIEIVIPKLFSWGTTDLVLLKAYVNNLKKLNFTCSSTQSITFNTSLQSVYDNSFIDHIIHVSKICKIIGVKTLVFGAPKLRTTYQQSKLISVFSKIDSILKTNNQILCIEPNCSLYGGNFFLNLEEIISFLKLGNFTNIKTMIDTHNLLNEGFNPSEEFVKYQNYITHIHISENQLGPIQYSEFHKQLGLCLKNLNYTGDITYEVSNLSMDEFENSLNLFNKLYNVINYS
jgi:sugar phosphate isomerase/epimerase